MRINKLPRRFVAVQRNELIKHRLCKQHRMTQAALIRSQHDLFMAFLFIAFPPMIGYADLLSQA